MEIGILMGKIDDISNQILKNDEKAFDNLLDLTDDIGNALEECAKHIEEMSRIGFCISEDDIMTMVESYGTALSQRDSMLMNDILCFEIYAVLNSYNITLHG